MTAKCSEPVSSKYLSIQCPNVAIGHYRDSGDVYEMRSYPMCAWHAKTCAEANIDAELVARDREAAGQALAKAQRERAFEMLDEYSK